MIGDLLVAFFLTREMKSIILNISKLVVSFITGETSQKKQAITGYESSKFYTLYICCILCRLLFNKFCSIKSLITEKEKCKSSFKFGLQVIASDSFLEVSLKSSRWFLWDDCWCWFCSQWSNTLAFTNTEGIGKQIA